MKKTWVKPKLIVLARPHPQEAVLNYCKNDWNTGGPFVEYLACDESFGVECRRCVDVVTS